MARSKPTVVYVRAGNPGMVFSILSCVFGVLGIFTIGIIFVPLAALCALFGFCGGLGLFRGLTDISISSVGVSPIGALLTVIAFGLSPTLLLIAAGGVIAGSHH
jgi:hypothetical protein